MIMDSLVWLSTAPLSEKHVETVLVDFMPKFETMQKQEIMIVWH